MSEKGYREPRTCERCNTRWEPGENEYFERWGTCNMYCYGVLVGAYPEPKDEKEGECRMKKYPYKIKIGRVQLAYRYDFSEDLIDKYHKDGWIYGYYADGMLIGDVVEFSDQYVAFEYWISTEGKTLKENAE